MHEDVGQFAGGTEALHIDFTGERIVPGAANCEPTFAQKMYQEHLARYAFAAQLAEGRDVLDLACGVGYGSQWLAKSGAKSVLGIDLAADAIEHAKKNYFHPSVSYRVEDATAMEYEQQFDLIACFEFIEHIDEQAKVLDGIKRALRPNGTLIISTPRPLDTKRTDFHVHELDFEELRALLAERFADVQSYFERNCFTSFVGAAMPDKLENVVSVTDQIKIENADYFIFVAKEELNKSSTLLDPLVTINDDRYVLTLEQDAVNFKNGENYHNQLISELSDKSEKLTLELSTMQSELEIHRKTAGNVDSLQQQMSEIVGNLADLREGVRASAELSAVKADLDAVKADLDAAHRSADQLLRQNETLIADNNRVRTVLSNVAQQLAETETRLNAKLAEGDLVASLRGELALAQEETQSVRHRFDECERTLNRFRRSVSWKATRPVRWIGRQYNKLAGRSVA